MATFFQRIVNAPTFILKHKWLALGSVVLSVFVSMLIALGIGKIYQNSDDDPARGAIAIGTATDLGTFGENYTIPRYIDQGWSESDSLWFYNATQGSGLLPYDFFLVLEQEDTDSCSGNIEGEEASEFCFRSNKNIDKYRYLPQGPTKFNPYGLPVGFTRDTYGGADYVGYTCAACHTAQVNYGGAAVRIDGGPAMADMVGFLTGLKASIDKTLDSDDKLQRFVDNVLALNNDYDDKKAIIADLRKWANTMMLYNTINRSSVRYGYARLDAFGRIYNRALQHVLNKEQLANALGQITAPRSGFDERQFILKDSEITKVLKGMGPYILLDAEFSEILLRLQKPKNEGYPALGNSDMLRVRNQIFNEPDAPVSYPFLWDIAQSNYVQWNGIANNYGVGPIGRNAGEVVGVFGILDFTAEPKSGFSLSSRLTGQERKGMQITFESSVDLVNLQRLESHLGSLQSPLWSDAAKTFREKFEGPGDNPWDINEEKRRRGGLLYSQYCQSCHEIIDRSNLDRIVIAKMSNLDSIGTDRAMASNSVSYSGMSGNLEQTVQSTGVGSVFIEENAPVAQILTSVVTGVIATPDPDKYPIRRWLDRIYTLASSFFENKMPNTIKSGNYDPDTTAAPYNSLLAYKARSLNGIWATAPYLHNGSVPTLYDLLLPKRRSNSPESGEYRPDAFMTGSREFDPVKVGFRSADYLGFEFRTVVNGGVGNDNGGHEYAAGINEQMDKNGEKLPALNEEQRWELIEYLKTL